MFSLCLPNTSFYWLYTVLPSLIPNFQLFNEPKNGCSVWFIEKSLCYQKVDLINSALPAPPKTALPLPTGKQTKTKNIKLLFYFLMYILSKLIKISFLLIWIQRYILSAVFSCHIYSWSCKVILSPWQTCCQSIYKESLNRAHLVFLIIQITINSCVLAKYNSLVFV